MAMSPGSIPVVLKVAGVEGEIGTVELPIATSPQGRDRTGAFRLAVEIDHTELRTRIADLLRTAADEIQAGGRS